MTQTPIDKMTDEELRLEYLRLAGWADVHNDLDNTGHLFGWKLAECSFIKACPDPTKNIADAMAALDGFDDYSFSKRSYTQSPPQYEVNIMMPKANCLFIDSDQRIAITHACVAALVGGGA